MTELTWQGKYDPKGNRLSPLRVELPFQTVETINESAQQRQKTLLGFHRERRPEWRNRLVWGDNKYVLPSLQSELNDGIDLIYIDPPFGTGQDFSFHVEVGGAQFDKQASIIEQKAYRDTWGKGFDSYLTMMSERLTLMRELLKPTGSIYVHLDPTVGHYVKVLMDEVFGEEAFQREIVWRIGWVSGYKSAAKNWIRNHDTILFYVKSPGKFTFNKKYTPYPEGYKRRGDDETGGKGIPIEDVWNANPSEHALTGEDSLDSIQIKSFSTEKTGYATQKNESLLRRIIEVSSNEGDLVADFFCGSGTTLTVAEKLHRRWIGCDLSRFAVHTTRKRLLSVSDVQPFVIQNLGKYERQLWQTAEFGEEAGAKVEAYRRFLLKLYRAEATSGFTWIQGSRGNRFVHVGSVDAPVTYEDVLEIVREYRAAIGSGPSAPKSSGIDVLGWDFAFELNEIAKQEAAREGVDLRFKRIPRDILDPRAVEQGEVKFFELAALASKVSVDGRAVSISLTDFVIPPDDVREDVRRTITHWVHWIDYWAVDWDNHGDTFHNEWQSFRSKAEPELKTKTSHTYSAAGKYSIVIKVIDLLGNDTTKQTQVKVG